MVVGVVVLVVVVVVVGVCGGGCGGGVSALRRRANGAYGAGPP